MFHKAYTHYTPLLIGGLILLVSRRPTRNPFYGIAARDQETITVTVTLGATSQ